MAAIDALLQRIADGQQRENEAIRDQNERLRTFEERSNTDRREIREKVDELLRLQHEERAILAELRHHVSDDVTDAFSAAFSTHRAIQTAAAGGEATGKHQLAPAPHDDLADLRGVRVPWGVVGKGLAVVGAGLLGWLVEHFKLLH